MSDALEGPTARGVAEHLLRGSLDAQTSNSDPKGCLSVISSVVRGVEHGAIEKQLARRRSSSHAQLVARFKRASAEQDFPANIEPEALARFLVALVQGMAVHASSGASRNELEQLVQVSLQIWPGH
jgi:hypothetical protein